MKKSKTIRICIVAPSFGILGGQAIQASRLLEDLSREPGIRAELLPINPRAPLPLGYLQRVKYLRTIVTTFLYVASLLTRMPRFDVVHVFSAAYFSFLLAPAPALLIARLYRKPVILNYHSGEAEDHMVRWRRIVPAVLRLADRIVVPSDYLVAVFDRFGISAQAIFNTVDLEKFAFRPRPSLRPIILSNRNLEKHYCVECTLRAFALVQSRAPSSRLIIAGDGSERARLEKLARELKITGVEFIGAVPPGEMPARYRECDIFVNASEVDNMPLSIIEAFAAGLPVVTTDAGGIPYIVSHGRNGLLVPRGDYRAMADAILTLLSNGLLAERLAIAAQRDSERYTWRAVRSAWLSLYIDLSSADGEPSMVPARVACDAPKRTLQSNLERESRAGRELTFSLSQRTDEK